MDIRKKLQFGYEELIEHGPINIVAFGDSVTHGAIGAGEIDFEAVYHHRLAKKISAIRNYTPVNVINAGIGGITAHGSLERMEKQVFAHNPDLAIVMFGLNDVNGPLDEYLGALKTIFTRFQERDIEVVFMTPNMLNTHVVEGTEPRFAAYAQKTADMQNNGRMDTYIYAAKDLALQMGVKVADCYSKWKELAKTQDTTMLLGNYINHPTREMHELFAQTLFETIFGGEQMDSTAAESTMYRK